MLKKAQVDLQRNVDYAIDGLECFEKVVQTYSKGQTYKLIITDFNMPKVGGLESSKKIRDFLTSHMKIPIED